MQPVNGVPLRSVPLASHRRTSHRRCFYGHEQSDRSWDGVPLVRDPKTKKRKYLNQVSAARAHLNKMLGQRDRGRNLA
jgi:hypothetical protein